MKSQRGTICAFHPMIKAMKFSGDDKEKEKKRLKANTGNFRYFPLCDAYGDDNELKFFLKITKPNIKAL